METEIRIQVPEGMEIDKENSTFECIKFKPKKLTYDYISIIMSPKTYPIYTIRRHQSKCDTFRKLLEVADYLNGNWKSDWKNQRQKKYYIYYDNENNIFQIGHCYYINEGVVFFSLKENVLKAIEIIGEVDINQFFSY